MKLKIKKIMFIGWRKCSMDWSKHLEHGLVESKATWLRMDFTKATMSEFDFQIYGDSKRHTLECWKIIMRYIAGTRDYGIMYASTKNKNLIGHTTVILQEVWMIGTKHPTMCFILVQVWLHGHLRSNPLWHYHQQK